MNISTEDMSATSHIEFLYKTQRKTMMSHARRRVGRECEDVVQTAFCSALQELDSHTPATESMDRYLNRHLCRATKAMQRSQRLEGMSYSLDAKGENEQVEPSYTLDFNIPLVQEVYLNRFAKSDSETQQIAHLFYDLSYTPLEISNITGLAHRHCRYVMSKLHEVLKEDLAEAVLDDATGIIEV